MEDRKFTELNRYQQRIESTIEIVKFANEKKYEIQDLKQICFSLISLSKKAPTLEMMESALKRQLEALQHNEDYRQEVNSILTSGKEINFLI